MAIGSHRRCSFGRLQKACLVAGCVLYPPRKNHVLTDIVSVMAVQVLNLGKKRGARANTQNDDCYLP